MFVATAYAAQGAQGSSGGLSAFAPLIILFIIFYFLLIRPQQKRARETRTMQDSIQVGDTIITNGGLYGTIKRVDGQIITLQCSDRVFIKIIKKAISTKVDPLTMEEAEDE